MGPRLVDFQMDMQHPAKTCLAKEDGRLEGHLLVTAGDVGEIGQ